MPRKTEPKKVPLPPRLTHVTTEITCSRCGRQEPISRTYGHTNTDDRISGRFEADIEFGNVNLPEYEYKPGEKWHANLIEADLCGQCTLDFIEWVKTNGGDVDYKYYDPMGG